VDYLRTGFAKPQLLWQLPFPTFRQLYSCNTQAKCQSIRNKEELYHPPKNSTQRTWSPSLVLYALSCPQQQKTLKQKFPRKEFFKLTLFRTTSYYTTNHENKFTYPTIS
jgi:hypothetical protein